MYSRLYGRLGHRGVPRGAPRGAPRVRQRCIAGISSLHLKLLLALFSTICIFAFSFIVVACQTQALGLLRYDFLGGHPYITSTKRTGGLVRSENTLQMFTGVYGVYVGFPCNIYGKGL